MGDATAEENARLKKELADIKAQQDKSSKQYDDKIEKMEERAKELESMRGRFVRLQRQLDEEVTRRDQAQQESQALEQKVMELESSKGLAAVDGQVVKASSQKAKKHIERSGSGSTDEQTKQQATQVSTKLMRVVDQWMRQRDLQQALLRGAAINDMSFSTLFQVLFECSSLQTLDLSRNQLTMDSCSDICQLITTCPSLAYVSLEGNLFSLRSVGYFMTAVMERQSARKFTPLDLLDLQGNEGLVAAISAPAPEALVRQVSSAIGLSNLPGDGPVLVTQVLRALWRFLHDTDHPGVKGTNADEVALHVMDKSTIRKMEAALMKILLLGGGDDEPTDAAGTPIRAVTADLAFLAVLGPPGAGEAEARQVDAPSEKVGKHLGENQREGGVKLPSIEGERGRGVVARSDSSTKAQSDSRAMEKTQQPGMQKDPFSDLRQVFEPPKEKMKTFNRKQIVTRSGMVLMNMLERLLETTDIDALDIETDETLLEYACNTGNSQLAKLCYRRGANLNARTKKGDTPLNIVTSNRRYDLMEFLHMYGVKVSSTDGKGRTALHIAAAKNDIDAACRLIEWGIDVNLRDKNRMTPLHHASAGGHHAVTMLLLEVGADMNAKDKKEYTAVAWSEANNHFELMDRLVLLGGKGHGLSKGGAQSQSAKSIGLGTVNVSSQMLKSSSLGRIGKVEARGMPRPNLHGTMSTGALETTGKRKSVTG